MRWRARQCPSDSAGSRGGQLLLTSRVPNAACVRSEGADTHAGPAALAPVIKGLIQFANFGAIHERV